MWFIPGHTTSEWSLCSYNSYFSDSILLQLQILLQLEKVSLVSGHIWTLRDFGQQHELSHVLILEEELELTAGGAKYLRS